MNPSVVPAKAGTQGFQGARAVRGWNPACAGMTVPLITPTSEDAK